MAATEHGDESMTAEVETKSCKEVLAPTGSVSESEPLSNTSSRMSQHTEVHQTDLHIGKEQELTSSPLEKDGVGEKAKFKEVTWDGDDDPMNPKNKPTWKKWLIVLVLGNGSLCVTFTSTIYTTTYEQMDVEFGTSTIVATLGLTLYVFGLGLAPMMLGPLSEFYGRRPIYVIGPAMFFVWVIPSAVAKNIQTMIVARFLDGFAGSAFLSVAGGTVGDLFSKDQLAAPMMIYSSTPFLGPGLGAIVGGFINYYIDWRWSYYVVLIWSGILVVIMALFVPETYAPVVLRNKARKMRSETGDPSWKATIEVTEKSILWTVIHSLYRPFLILFLDPMCFSLSLFSAILLGILYLFFAAFPLVFGEIYSFNLWEKGLAFTGILIGMIIAISTVPIWRRTYTYQLDRHEKKEGVRASEPEYRLPSSVVGSWLCVIGLFWFGWTIYRSVHWIVPMIGTAFFGCGIILTYVGIFTFLVEAFPLYAASALSANSFARSSFAGAFPLFGKQMYEKLGFHWATTLLALLTLMMAPFPYLFYIFGKKLRSKSRFSPEQK